MPLTFGEAYKIVCPDGCPIVPHSREHKDIVELMKQSGHLHFTERLIHEAAEIKPRTMADALPYSERHSVVSPGRIVSKNDWMKVTANREPYLAHHSINMPEVETSEPIPEPVPEPPPVPYVAVPGRIMSKIEWMKDTANRAVYRVHRNINKNNNNSLL